MSIYYLCPDYPHPSGGVKRIYSHVEILRRGGMDAHVLHMQEGFKPGWFDTDIEPMALGAGLRLGRGDHIVVPESLADLLPQLPDCNRVLLVLNPYYIFNSSDPAGVLELSGRTAVMTNSQAIADFLSWYSSRDDIVVVGTGVDDKLFHPRETPGPGLRRSVVRVAFTRRKDTASDMAILMARERLAPSGLALEALDMEDLPLEEYAASLRRADIWLTTALVHGFPRSTLEAMACGCLCMGFAGACAGDVIEPGRNFVAVPDGDLFALTRELVRSAAAVRRDAPSVRETVRGALQTAAGFSPEHEERSVLDAWRRLAGGA